MRGGKLTTAGLQPAVLAGSGGEINLIDVVVHTNDNGIKTQKLETKDAPLTTQGLQAQYAQSKITMTRGAITTTGVNPAVLAGSGEQIDLINVFIKTNDIGLQAQDEQSKITMRGGKLVKTGTRSTIFATYGGQIDLQNAQVQTNKDGLAIRGKQSKITLKNSEVHANLVLVGRPNEGDTGEANVIADHSILAG
ncbi:hypothetical protein [Bartonella gliris]|nr:hypothetical protein [Bartonella gliris]